MMPNRMNPQSDDRLPRRRASARPVKLCVFCGFAMLLHVVAIQLSLRANAPTPKMPKLPGPAVPTDRSWQKLLQEALPEKSPAAKFVDETVDQMREAGTRLGDNKADAQTRQLQQKAVERLDQLIQALKVTQKSAARSMPAAATSPAPSPAQPAQTEQESPPPDSASGRRTPESAGESTAQTEQGEQRSGDVSSQEVLEQEVWGHLPPRLRQELINAYNEQYLPKYAEQIRRYYEALARQRAKSPSSP